MATIAKDGFRLCYNCTRRLKFQKVTNPYTFSISKSRYSVYATLNKKFTTFKISQNSTNQIIVRHLSPTSDPNKMGDKPENIVTYEEMKTFENNNKVLIIDVREPDEILASGKIDGSINMPVSCVEHLKELSGDDFKNKYGKPKPDRNFPLIFMCKMGMRASKAAGLTENLGYTNVKVYKGSWDDWEQKKKEETKS